MLLKGASTTLKHFYHFSCCFCNSPQFNLNCGLYSTLTRNIIICFFFFSLLSTDTTREGIRKKKKTVGNLGDFHVYMEELFWDWAALKWHWFADFCVACTVSLLSNSEKEDKKKKQTIGIDRRRRVYNHVGTGSQRLDLAASICSICTI